MAYLSEESSYRCNAKPAERLKALAKKIHLASGWRLTIGYVCGG